VEGDEVLVVGAAEHVELLLRRLLAAGVLAEPVTAVLQGTTAGTPVRALPALHLAIPPSIFSTRSGLMTTLLILWISVSAKRADTSAHRLAVAGRGDLGGTLGKGAARLAGEVRQALAVDQRPLHTHKTHTPTTFS
jgi:hypothetical protein